MANPQAEEFMQLVATLGRMEYKDALSYVTDPANDITPEMQRYLLIQRSRIRCTSCTMGPG